MKKIVFLIAFVSSLSAMAQLSVGVNVGYDAALGTAGKDLKSGEKPTFGALSGGFVPISLDLRYGFSDLFVKAGYDYNVGLEQEATQNKDSYKTNLNVVTIGAGYNVVSKDKFKTYGGIDLGLGFWSLKYIYKTYDVLDSVATSFVFRPNVGVIYNLSDNLFLNGNVRYALIATSGDHKTKGGSTTFQMDNSNLFGVQVGIGYKF